MFNLIKIGLVNTLNYVLKPGSNKGLENTDV